MLSELKHPFQSLTFIRKVASLRVGQSMRTIELLCNRLDSLLGCTTLQVFVRASVFVATVVERCATFRIWPFARWDSFRVHFAAASQAITLSAPIAGTIFQ